MSLICVFRQNWRHLIFRLNFRLFWGVTPIFPPNFQPNFSSEIPSLPTIGFQQAKEKVVATNTPKLGWKKSSVTPKIRLKMRRCQTKNLLNDEKFSLLEHLDWSLKIVYKDSKGWRDSRESIRTIRANRVICANRKFKWFVRIGLMRYKIGVSIANASRESIRANRIANRPCH